MGNTRIQSPTPTPKQPLSGEELSRFSRHILLPEVGRRGQERLKAARVLIIGTGGLGSPVGLYLAAAGVGTLGLVEFDVVDRSNLHRQILYTDGDVGRPKIEAAVARLKAIYPQLQTEAFETSLTVANATEIIDQFDLVIDGTDNFKTRYLVNDACVLLGKPNVYGSIFRFDGQASVFDARTGPCYRCLFPAPPPAGLVPSCVEGGVLGVLPGLVGLIQATEALKLILGIGTGLSGRVLTIDALSMNFHEFQLGKNPDCPACGENSKLKKEKRLQRGDDLAPTAACETKTNKIKINSAEAHIMKDSFDLLTVKELQQWRESGKKHWLVDVRSPEEVEICQIEGSKKIPLPELQARVEELRAIKPGVPLVVYCKSGGRSAQAAEYLYTQGFKSIFNLTGGILAWIKEIDPKLSS